MRSRGPGASSCRRRATDGRGSRWELPSKAVPALGLKHCLILLSVIGFRVGLGNFDLAHFWDWKGASHLPIDDGLKGAQL